VTGSIGGRLILVLTLCLALITSAGMWLDYRLSRQDIVQGLQLQARDTVDGVLTDMDNWLDAVEGSTLFLGRILQQQEYPPDQLRQLLQDVVENNEDIFGATIALDPKRYGDARGFAPYYFRGDDGIAYADLAAGDGRYWDKSWFASPVASEQPVWVEPYFDRGGGEVLMTTFAVPVYTTAETGERELFGVVTADITLEELQNYLARLKLSASGSAILLSREGVILSARNRSLTMRHYTDTAGGKRELQAWRQLVSAALAGETIERQLPCPDTSGSCVVRMDALDSTGWPVGVVHPEREMLAPLRQFQLKLGLTSLFTLLLLGLAVYLVTRRITRPLAALATASSELARGKLDTTLPAARGRDEVATLVRSFHVMREDLQNYIDDLEAATASRSRLEGELAAARDIQMSMLPQGGEAMETDPAFRLWATVIPAKSVGGDLYTYHHRDGLLYIAVGDVSDKGVPAALFMARAISFIQQWMGSGIDPTEAMALINNLLEEGNDNCMFLTLFLGVLDLESLELRFASGGHTEPALLRNGRPLTLAQDSGAALGLARDQGFTLNRVQLQAGDRLALWTDGIDEAFNTQREMFGLPRLLEAFLAGGNRQIEDAGTAILGAVQDFSSGTSQSDDITLLLLEIPAADLSAERHQRDFTLGQQLVSRVLGWLESILPGVDLPTEATMEMQLVAEEIVTNVDKYAGLGAADSIDVTVEISAGEWVLQVADGGKPFNPLVDAVRSELGADIDSAGIGGLGVHLITRLTDRQSYRRSDGRNVLRVTRTLSARRNWNE
jgi:sigma-B regulation protein RsbU (phosphoserine phosphatase)